MKKIIAIIFAVTLVNIAFAQKKYTSEEAAEEVKKVFTWDIERAQHGSLMFLDIPFRKDTASKIDYIALSVAKANLKDRPDFISIVTPNNIVQTNGVFVHFATTTKDASGKESMELTKGNPARVEFQMCDGNSCTARVIGGLVTDAKTKQETDIFQKMLDFDHMIFLFVYPDGVYKSVSMPLASFKKQYAEIVAKR